MLKPVIPLDDEYARTVTKKPPMYRISLVLYAEGSDPYNPDLITVLYDGGCEDAREQFNIFHKRCLLGKSHY